MFLVAVLAVLAVLAVAALYAAERVRRNVVAAHRHRIAEERLQAVMAETGKRLELEKKKREGAAALTSVVPAIKRRGGTRHVA